MFVIEKTLGVAAICVEYLINGATIIRSDVAFAKVPPGAVAPPVKDREPVVDPDVTLYTYEKLTGLVCTVALAGEGPLIRVAVTPPVTFVDNQL